MTTLVALSASDKWIAAKTRSWGLADSAFPFHLSGGAKQGSMAAREVRMDITFSCEKCGQKIVVDEAGGGITVDCPRCGRPVYMPSSAPSNTTNPPVRIETASAKPMTTASPIAPVPIRPVGLTASLKHEDFHPSIVASLRCLIIGAVLLFAKFIALHEDFRLVFILVYIATPFLVAALLCAVYGMCIGQVNQGLLLVAGLSLVLGLFYWISFRTIPSPTDIQRQVEQQMRQLMH